MKFSVSPGGAFCPGPSGTRPAARPSFIWIALVVVALELAVLPERALGQRPVGVDVSTFQGSINWASVKASGITFASARATEGTGYIYDTFNNNETKGT